MTPDMMTPEERQSIQDDIDQYCMKNSCLTCPMQDRPDEDMVLCSSEVKDLNDDELMKVWKILMVTDISTEQEHDPVNHPEHYTNRSMECIDEMVAVFGPEAVRHFCICNVWKYRYRADSKGDAEQDRDKADWYMRKYMELKGQ